MLKILSNAKTIKSFAWKKINKAVNNNSDEKKGTSTFPFFNLFYLNQIQNIFQGQGSYKDNLHID